jgi:hypothetical protein
VGARPRRAFQEVPRPGVPGVCRDAVGRVGPKTTDNRTGSRKRNKAARKCRLSL